MAANGNHELLEQWIKILQHQEHLHSLEIQAWQRKIEDAASHLHQVSFYFNRYYVWSRTFIKLRTYNVSYFIVMY